MAWGLSDIPEQSGRTIVVTGGNSGLGFQSAKALAERGAHVVLACRSLEKAGQAAQEITRSCPSAKLETRALDLASLDSVRRFADELRAAHPRIDVLLNNAGVMALPRHETTDGFEMQIGTNHFGHFALTGQLIDRVLAAPEGRVVTVSSQFHRLGKINFDDLHGRKSYSKWGAYGQSKLANLLFAFELQRRFAAKGVRAKSLAAHPGYASTELQTKGPRMEGSTLMERLSEIGNSLLAQSAAQGALPQIRAATGHAAENGDYFGPDGLMEMRGAPEKVGATAAAKDADAARRLWELSEEATGVRWEAL